MCQIAIYILCVNNLCLNKQNNNNKIDIKKKNKKNARQKTPSLLVTVFCVCRCTIKLRQASKFKQYLTLYDLNERQISNN